MDSYAILPLLLQTLVWIPTRIVLKLFYKLEICGLENISRIKGPAIFASNHTSELDCVLIPESLPFLSKFMPIFYTCREKSFYRDKKFGWRRHVYGGKFFNAWGAYEVTVGMHNYELALKNHIMILKDGHSVCIFPEAKKNIEGKEIGAKGGVAYLSYVTNTPIVPLRIDGAVKKEKIIINFGKPIYPENLFSKSKKPIISKHHDDYKTAATLVMHKIREI